MATVSSLKVRFIGADGKTLAETTADGRVFASGKVGFGSYGRVQLGGTLFQLSLNLVKVTAPVAKASGSAPTSVEI